jgi:pilus assembly protein CpaF
MSRSTTLFTAAPVRERISTSVLERLGAHPDMDDHALKRLIAHTAARELSGSRLAWNEQQHMIEHLYHAMRGYDVLQPLMDDASVTEIMVNGPGQVYYESGGVLRASDIRFEDTDHLFNLIVHLFSRATGASINPHPSRMWRLPDGSRANAVCLLSRRTVRS